MPDARELSIEFIGGPLTYRVLSEAATALGADPDKVLEDPQSEFDSIEPTIPEYARFIRVVCRPQFALYWRRRGIAYDPAPWFRFWSRRKPDLFRTSSTIALKLGRELAASFWSAAWLESTAARPDRFVRYILGGESRPSPTNRERDSFAPLPGPAS